MSLPVTCHMLELCCLDKTRALTAALRLVSVTTCVRPSYYLVGRGAPEIPLAPLPDAGWVLVCVRGGDVGCDAASISQFSSLCNDVASFDCHVPKSDCSKLLVSLHWTGEEPFLWSLCALSEVNKYLVYLPKTSKGCYVFCLLWL